MMLLDYKNKNALFHIIGIGGIGMSAIAQIMHKNGQKVQGSDLSDGYSTENLKKLGIEIFIGHDVKNIYNADYVIISSAIKDSNPELVAARSQGKIIVKRHEILAEIMRTKIGVSISGTHGKTTTTSIVANLFEEAEADPTVITGGIINNKGTNGYVGSGDFIVVEADESDSTFAKIPSQIAVITNIEPEHLDFYGTFDNLLNDFKVFVTQLPFYGFAVVCVDDKHTRALISEISNKNIVTYGIDSVDANLKASNIKQFIDHTIFDVSDEITCRKLCDITLSVSGMHNVLNALAPIAIGFQMNFSDDVIKNALKNFSGVKRRFTKTGTFNGATIMDDYAHHPTEVKATLANARNFVHNTGGKVIAVFQPHRYSRLQNLMQEFSCSFSDADIVYITDIYSAGENAIEGIDSEELIAMLIDSGKKKIFKIDNLESLASDLKNKALVTSGDLVIFMGAGDITEWAYKIVEIQVAV
jgi:UDP-N-acetylmuramate--alanine ligase